MIEKYLWFYYGNHCCKIIQTGKITMLHSGRINNWSDKIYSLVLRPIDSITDDEWNALHLKYAAEFQSDSASEQKQIVINNARMTADLIHLNIDVFGLIDKGLAYDILRKKS